MRSSIQLYKEKLSQLALEEDSDDEFEIGLQNNQNGILRSEQNNHEKNNTNPEIEFYKTEIQRLQSNEAEIHAMSVNYANLLKQRDEELRKVVGELESLKKSNANGNIDFVPPKIQQPSKQIRYSNSQFDSKIKKLQEKEKDLRDRLQEKDDLFEILKKENDKLQGELNRVRVKNDELNGQVADLREVVDVRNSEVENLREEIEKNRNDKKRIDDLEKENDRLLKLVNEFAKNAKDGFLGSSQNHEIVDGFVSNSREDLRTEVAQGQAGLKNSRNNDGDLKIKISELETRLRNSQNNEEGLRIKVVEMEKSLKTVVLERDKVKKDLGRLKQHLLQKEQEENEKMDGDIGRITELQAQLDAKNRQIFHLEQSLKRAVADQEEIKRSHLNEKCMVSELQNRLEACVSALQEKNVEVQNLQSVLGQYYAEIESKDRVYAELSSAREEISKLLEKINEAHCMVEVKKREKEEVIEKLRDSERGIVEAEKRSQSLEDQISRLRKALEQSMSSLNRISSDSEYNVDRRIVIKLLVTYFQRQHSKEVLDLMVNMLGFSEDEKRAITFAQQGSSKGVVRGVLGLPGRLVGGMLGGGTANVSQLENQSFQDLWVDFLLKQSEERENAETQAKGVAQK